MSKLAWYWHRLRAMSPGEMLLHARKKCRQAADAKRTHWPEADLTCAGHYPQLPPPAAAPAAVREALRHDAQEILAGRWRFFGHLELKVDDPPRWQCDYLVGRDLERNQSAFKLNYRALPEGVDSKIIWEPSRWYQLVRLAMAAYVLNDRRAGEKCLDWLEDWVKRNPPYRGWNWTSALEVGMRLIQFTWIDALLGDPQFSTDDSQPGTSPGNPAPGRQSRFVARLADLRRAILPAHVWYAWRHRSFGSSANNHLLGELAGCIVATARWPGLARCGAGLEELHRRWEFEVLAQFAEDGGNREQALSYQLFSWEFCWQAQQALFHAGRAIAPEVTLRLAQAAGFFVKVRGAFESWDYGDSDNAYVSPLFLSEARGVEEWWQWMADRTEKTAGIDFWLGRMVWASKERLGGAHVETSLPDDRRVREHHRRQKSSMAGLGQDWLAFRETGFYVTEDAQWRMRWDLSPLGYLATAAHGHLDALHVSIWFRGVAMVIDPGTGCYHADKRVRHWLASRDAHNAPVPDGIDDPVRLGAFLWSHHHRTPLLSASGEDLTGVLNLRGVQIRRTISPSPARVSWKIEDRCIVKDGADGAFTVRWQFAPGSWVQRSSDRVFTVHRGEVSLGIEVDERWAAVELVEPSSGAGECFTSLAASESLEGLVSPAFRKLCRAPFLKLTARPQGDKPCLFTTTFLASPRS